MRALLTAFYFKCASFKINNLSPNSEGRSFLCLPLYSRDIYIVLKKLLKSNIFLNMGSAALPNIYKVDLHICQGYISSVINVSLYATLLLNAACQFQWIFTTNEIHAEMVFQFSLVCWCVTDWSGLDALLNDVWSFPLSSTEDVVSSLFNRPVSSVIDICNVPVYCQHDTLKI